MLVIYEGAADVPSDELEGGTPLALARNVNSSALAGRGVTGVLEWRQEISPDRTETALAELLGVMPDEAMALRRGPVETAGTGLDPASWTYAYRGNYVPSDGQELKESRVSGLSLDETEWPTDIIQESLSANSIFVKVIGPARVVMAFDQLNGKVDPGSFPATGSLVDFNKEALGIETLSHREQVMKLTAELLAGQTINDVRLDLGENPASLVWLWGGGPPVEINRPFSGAPLKAAMVTNSPMAKGLARLCRMSCLDLGDVWSETTKPELIDAPALAKCVDGHELTVVYVEAPGEGGSYGSPVEKVKMLDRLDIHVLGRVLEALESTAETRVMVTALPPEGVQLETVPILLCGSGVKADASTRWDETMCNEGAMGRVPADRVLTKLAGD